MKLIHSYWLSLSLSATFYVMYMFAPWSYGTLMPEMQTLLSYGGYGSLVESPDWIFWLQLAIALIGYIGMALFRSLFRLIFVAFTVITLLLAPFFGASVITGIEVFIIDASTLLSGFALGLVYYTRLNDKFY